MPLSHSKSKVCFFFPEVRVSLTQRAELKKYILFVFKSKRKTLDKINYIFCTDRAILEINRSYLAHDYYTDIITFDLSDSTAINAEVYISVDRVRENAHDIGVSFKSELHRVIFHGVLHLCGLNDKTEAERIRMRAAEDQLLTSYFG